MNLVQFPTGSVASFASAFGIYPAGWVKCNGDLYDYSLDTYAPLYAVIGTTYGSGSGTGFRVPNLGQRVVRGGLGLGAWGGATTHALTHNQSGIRDHGHTVTESAHSHTISDKGHTHDQATNVTNVNFKAGSVRTDVSGPNDDLETTREYSGLGDTWTGGNYGTDISTGSSAAVPNPAISSTADAHENRMPFIVMQYLIKL